MFAWIAPQTFHQAQATCMALGGHITTYTEIRQLALANGGVAIVALNGDWIGERTGDDQALAVNSRDINNFDGVLDKNTSHWFRCAHASSWTP